MGWRTELTNTLRRDKQPAAEQLFDCVRIAYTSAQRIHTAVVGIDTDKERMKSCRIGHSVNSPLEAWGNLETEIKQSTCQ